MARSTNRRSSCSSSIRSEYTQNSLVGEFTAYFLDPGQISAGSVICRRVGEDVSDGWLHFANPRRVRTARSSSELTSLLVDLDDSSNRGEWVAGFISYDAGPSLDGAIVALQSEDRLLAWLGFYDSAPRLYRELLPIDANLEIEEESADFDLTEYSERFENVKARIASGEVYQVNLTYRVRYQSNLDGFDLFRLWCGIDPPPYACYIQDGGWQIASLSPELFLGRHGSSLTMKPMKGTAARGRNDVEESAARTFLRSDKTFAENLMIVDMVRNDLGKIAKFGTVLAPRLMETEIHGDLLQVTTEVTAESKASQSDVLRAVFPPASVTGAPKVSSCKAISELEVSPRGIYCGTIGYWGPEETRLNVAIRTAYFTGKDSKSFEYGIGGGIVWDSRLQDEYEETRLKLSPVLRKAEQWRLIEAFAVTAPSSEIDAHLGRLQSSASAFNIPLDRDLCFANICAEIESNSSKGVKVRISLPPDGRFQVEIGPSLLSRTDLAAHLSTRPVKSDDQNYRIKTNSKQLYLEQRKLFRTYDDVLFYNEKDELTEFTAGNVVVRFGKDLIAPLPESGLLEGITLKKLLAGGTVQLGTVCRWDLKGVDEFFIVNAVVGMRPIKVVLSAE